VRASMVWSDEVGGRRPEIAAGAAPRLCRARHPLLVEALAGAGRADEVVPLDLELPDTARALVISGPNAGGKTVAMKTIGVLVMLAQCGWDVPAREDTRLPLVDQVFVDLGDEQSIEDSLSSFSAHLTHLQHFLTHAGPSSLLLCDEIGSGTDPQEGTALALTVLERLIDRGALVVASTHYGLLKAAVHDHPAMINAAMDFDEASLAPLFTLRLGDPGASHAFDIAARVGLDRGLLDQARALVGEERYQLEQLLADLARRATALERREEAARELETANRRRERELAERLRGLDSELAAARKKARQEGEELVRQWRRRLEQAVREVRSEGAARTVVQRAHRQLAEVRDALPETGPEAAGAPSDLAAGDRVRVPHLGLTGRVTEVRGDKVGVTADGLRVSVDRGSVERVDRGDEAPAPATPTATAGAWTWDQDDPGIPPELDLRGLTAEEAWLRLDRMIDRAVPVGLDQITVVHGMGTGRLRDQLLARLARDARVASFHPGGERQNNFGATVVHLV
ncbi:endonuclease MutS2, partial [bacterium]|nr:endonuclease MutS2 [bacterium]